MISQIVMWALPWDKLTASAISWKAIIIINMFEISINTCFIIYLCIVINIIFILHIADAVKWGLCRGTGWQYLQSHLKHGSRRNKNKGKFKRRKKQDQWLCFLYLCRCDFLQIICLKWGGWFELLWQDTFVNTAIENNFIDVKRENGVMR